MKFHGVDIQGLSQTEIFAASEAIQILHDLNSDLYGTDNKTWRILERAARYLHDIIQPGLTGKVPRTFNRDLIFPVKKDADGNHLCRWCQKPVGKRRSYCNKD